MAATLFTDVTGFTTLVETLDREVLQPLPVYGHLIGPNQPHHGKAGADRARYSSPLEAQ
jgi:hypothetical protein